MSAYAFVVREPKASHFAAGYQRLEAANAAPTIARSARKRALRKQRPLFAAYSSSGARL